MLTIQKYFKCCKRIDDKNLDLHEFRTEKIVTPETSPKIMQNLLFADRDNSPTATDFRAPSMISNSSFSFGKYASQTTIGTFLRSPTLNKNQVPANNISIFKSMKDLKNSRTQDLKKIDEIPERQEKRQAS